MNIDSVYNPVDDDIYINFVLHPVIILLKITIVQQYIHSAYIVHCLILIVTDCCIHI